MRTYQEIYEEIRKLNVIEKLDESGIAVRMITLIALEWALGLNPISPSDRLKEVRDELALEGVVSDGEASE